ncbi:MAG: hypothetical protein KF832_14305 [Caldilineaceae bacterium]|nr:hypothetical protein [Caldilineaceae bacterium]
MRRFWASEANKFTLYGALFGLLFPVIATILEAMLKVGNLSWEAIVTVQRSDPLLWIIDSAPFWLGIFARFAGRRQDYLKRLLMESGRDPAQLPHQTEDAGQFAGTLTNFGLALIAVVLLGLGMWIQNLITSQQIGATNNAPTVVANAGGALTSTPIGAQAPVVLNLPTATPTVAEPTVTAITVTEPTVAAASATNTPIILRVEEVVGTQTALGADQSPITLITVTVPRGDTAPLLTTTPLEPTMQRVRLGYLESNADCRFFSQLAAHMWPQTTGVAVELSPFANSDLLFAALNATDPAQQIDLTLCFFDPENRTYLQQYISAFQVIGKTFWRGRGYQLMAVANTRSAYLIRTNQACLYNLIRNQSYADLVVDTLDPAQWLAENQETVTTWAACSPP